jgi:glutamate-1-semialdehyde 2,1-aminomutase
MRDMSMFQRAQNCIGQGALTNSKHPDSHILGVFPTHLSKKPGSGCFVYDDQNNQYIDYICGLGTNLLGYGNGHICEAVKPYLQYGSSHSLPTIFEIEAAESLKQMFYFVQKWKFVKSGSQACTAAIKMARAYTGRKIVLSQGYHGHEDEFVSLTPPASGVHTCTEIFSLETKIDPKTVAAIIIEPVITDCSVARTEQLKELRAYCDLHEIVLIFDETITGYRYDKHCVALSTNVLPDLIILGKAIANGFSLAAVGGKAKILDGNYFVSSTYAGEILPLVACKATTDLILNNQQYKIDKLWEQGAQFIRRFNNIMSGRIELEGYPTRGVFKGSDLDVALFRQEACKAKILLHKSWFYNFALMREDYLFFTFLQEFSKNLRQGQVKLEGVMPKSPFAQKVRENESK